MAPPEPPNAPASLLSRLAWMARTRNGSCDTSIRGFAREIGVSHTVITRIESGQVKKPNRDVLARLAVAAYREPSPLLYAAGHFTADDFRNSLKPLFAAGGPLVGIVREAGTSPELSLEEILRRLRAAQVSAAELDELAEAVFSIEQVGPGMGDRLGAARMLTGDSAAGAAALREIAEILGYVEENARDDLLRYARSLRLIADLEYQAEARQAALASEITEDRHE